MLVGDVVVLVGEVVLVVLVGDVVVLVGDVVGKFVMYDATLTHKTYRDGKLENCEWVCNIYGKTLWEMVAKMIIAIYADIKKGEKENG